MHSRARGQDDRNDDQTSPRHQDAVSRRGSRRAYPCSGGAPPLTRNFLPQAASRPDEVAVRGLGRSRTWAELEANTARVANGLVGAGLGVGDAVAVMASNSPEWVELILGNVRAGTRLVPINWHLTPSEAHHILMDSGARLLVTDPDHVEVAAQAAQDTSVATTLRTGDPWDSWLEGQSGEYPANDVAGGVILYTSGTTGLPKGVLRSDQSGSVADAFERYRQVGDFYRYVDGGAHLVACPLYHASPPAHVFFALTHDQSIVLMDRFDAGAALHLIEEFQVTSTHLVPTQFVRLLRLPDAVKTRFDHSSLATVYHGAAPCPDWVKRAMIDWWGPVIIEYFGSSEGTGPLIASSEEWLAHPGTVGRPGPALEVSVVDDGGNELPRGEIGTLYFRRADGAPEYLGDPDKAAGMRLGDGRFTVGDVGRIDDDGFVYLSDRKVDMIIAGGVNIYPAEIEGALLAHPAVADCAVFGVPDPEWGEAVKAAVAVSPGAEVTAEELTQWCKTRLAGFKCPRSIDFHDALPREETGKMRKRLLRAPYWESVSAD